MPSFDRCTIYNVINKYGTAAEERINKMEKKEQLYEGKAKKVFATDDPDLVIVSYKDDATAFNGLKKGTISGKGVINNKMTNYMFGLLEKAGVPTHLVKELNDRETLVKKGFYRSPRSNRKKRSRRQLLEEARHRGRHKAPLPHT